MLHLLQMGPFKVLTSLSLSRSKTLGSSHSWSCVPCYVPASLGDPTPTNTVSSASDSSCLYISPMLLGSSSLLSADAALPPQPHLQTFYLPLAHLVSSPSIPSPQPCVLGCFCISPASSRFFNGILEVSETRALN